MRYLLLLILFVGCSQYHNEELSSIQITDRSGFQETISNRDRLKELGSSDFTEPQPYQKVVRVYQKDRVGKIASKVSSYHDNGYLHQMIEVVNGRASGAYLEYHDNGQLRIEAVVMEGVGDLTDIAKSSWIFNGISRAWDSNGNLLAHINYEKGKLVEKTEHYYPDGAIKMAIPYTAGFVNGDVQEFDQAGDLIGLSHFEMGVPESKAYFIGDGKRPKFNEYYRKGKLLDAVYFDLEGNKISAVSNGKGWVSKFYEGRLTEKRECTAGAVDGQVKIYGLTGDLENTYIESGGEKHGEEILFYPMSHQPKLSIQWYEGEVHGKVKTYYPDGKVESEKEMNHNQNEGLAFAWYTSGDLMLVEEYEGGRLLQGKYFEMGMKDSVSRIIHGTGVATLYDKGGTFIRKVNYEKSRVIDEHR